MSLLDADDNGPKPTRYVGQYIFKSIHARVGNNKEVVEAICITSIPLNIIIIFVVLFYIHKKSAKQRISFRLSASTALADIMYSVSQIVLNKESYTDKMSELGLRAMFFLHLMSLAAMLFNTVCIAFHLHLTSINSHQRFAKKISTFYELISWVSAAILAHPVFYIFKHFAKLQGLNVIVFVESSWPKIWGAVFGIFGVYIISILYCVFVCILVTVRLLPIWKLLNTAPASLFDGDQCPKSPLNPGPDNDESLGLMQIQHTVSEGREDAVTTTTIGHTGAINTGISPQTIKFNLKESESRKNTYSSSSGFNSAYNLHTQKSLSKGLTIDVDKVLHKQRREIKFAVVRVALYPLIPLITITPLPVYMILKDPSYNLGYMAKLLPSIGGLLNFFVFCMNPTFDPLREKCLDKIKNVLKRDSYYKTTTISDSPSDPIRAECKAAMPSRMQLCIPYNPASFNYNGSNININNPSLPRFGHHSFNNSNPNLDKASVLTDPHTRN